MEQEHKEKELTMQELIALINNSEEDFHLIYDTYPNGVARLIIDRYRTRNDEYEIEFQQNGTLNEVKYYRNKRQRKIIK